MDQQDILILSAEQCAEARHMREVGDKTYAQVAKHFGVSLEAIKHAIAGTGDYAPPPAALTPLEALVAKAEADGPASTGYEDPELLAAANDRKLTEAEKDSLEIIYRAGKTSFETMAAALDPPVHWLTVQDALGERGWYRPDMKTIGYSTSTDEGKARFAREMSMGGVGLRPAQLAADIGPVGDASAEARQRTAERAAEKAAQMGGGGAAPA